jgi:type I restriction enzyme S subunit
LVDAGDILVSTVRPNLNAVAVVDDELVGATASTGFSVLRVVAEKATSRYIYHWVRTPAFVADMVRKATGASYPAISDKIVAESLIPLPPIEEQRQIAGILDAADALRRRRREALALLDTLPGAIFAEMFGVLTTSNRFPRGPLSNLITGFDTGKNLAPASDEEGTRHRVLKVSAVTKGEFIESESKPLPAEYSPPASHFVKSGDLLFSRANTSALIGATAMVDDVSDNIVLPDKIWRFLVDEEKAERIFLHYLFGTRKFRDEVSRRATGSSGSMKNISKDKVLSIEVGQPPIEMQREFSRRVRIARGMRTKVTEHLAELEALFASLQSRAFAGAL